MIAAFPLMLIMVIAYTVYVTTNGAAQTAASLDAPFFSLGLPQDELSLTLGNLFVLIALVLLFIEIVKSTSTSTRSIVNHGLSMLVFVIAIFQIVTMPGYATFTYLMITLFAGLDVVAGFVITTVTARRDFGLG